MTNALHRIIHFLREALADEATTEDIRRRLTRPEGSEV